MPPKPSLSTALLLKPTTTTTTTTSLKPLHSLLPPSLNPQTTLISLLSTILKTHPPSSLPSLLSLHHPHLLPYLTPSTLLLLLPLSHHTLSLLTLSHPHLDPLSSLLLSTPPSSPSSVFDLLLISFSRLNLPHQAIQCLHRLTHLGFAPNRHSFNSLLSSLIRARKFPLCWDVYGQMRNSGVAPNNYTFNMLVLALCRGEGGDAEKAVEFLEEQGFDPDVVTYNTLIDGYCTRGRLDEGVGLFKVMCRRGTEPDLVTYTVLIKGLCKEGRMDEARRMFETMVRRGLSPDGFCFGVLICGYCKNGMMVEARLVLDDLIRCGLKPDGFTCRVLVEGYVKVGKLLPCLNMISDLQKHGVVVRIDEYMLVLHALSSERRPNAMKRLLDWMVVRDGYKPNLDVYNLVIRCFCECEYIKEAFDVKEEMIEREVRPGLDTYQILIRCLCRFGKVEVGECLITEMVEYSLVPDALICADLVGAYCKKRELRRAESVLSYFAREFEVYDSRSYNALLKILCEEGEVGKSFELQNRMLKLGFKPNAEACKFLIRGLSKSRILSLCLEA